MSSNEGTDRFDPLSRRLARRGLLLTLLLAWAGAALGVVGALMGSVTGPEVVLVFCSVLFSSAGLLALLRFKQIALQTIATVSTLFFLLNLSSGLFIAILGPGERFNLFVYLFWFFPLLVFNQLVNEPTIGRNLGKCLAGAPVAILLILSTHLPALFGPARGIVLLVFSLSYLCFGFMLSIVTRYREEYIIECERAEALKLESKAVTEAHRLLSEQAELLDKAQDAIFVQDMESRILYWNKSAEQLYGWSSEQVLGRPASEIFRDPFTDRSRGIDHAVEHGEWSGELTQSHTDGSTRIVESRYTLVTEADGSPRSILAINTDVTERRTAEARVHHLAFYDPLTGLPNRQLLRDRLDKALLVAARERSMGALFFIDLDDFKTLNDTAGHDIGDLLLQQVALRMPNGVRATDTVARLGGDEFLIMLTGLTGEPEQAAAEARNVAEKILDAFLDPYSLQSYEHKGTTSIGVALFHGAPDTVDELLKKADLAMYQAKEQGRNTLCFFDPIMETHVASRAVLQSDLRRALLHHQFELHYQPQVDREGRVVSAEALLRWRHPTRGMVPPSEFIPLAEDAGMIVSLGRWVLETACAQLAQWARNPLMEPLSVAVNVSMRQFHDASFVDLVPQILRNSGANPQRLKLEITESCMMDKVDETVASMAALKEWELGFSLDDFGTGYSSLSHLKRLPLDQLKIDRSFVMDVLTDSRNASIVRTIITLGQNLQLTVIAEGVETVEQRDFLAEEGCLLYQGYLFSPALSATRFEAFVAAAAAGPTFDAA